MIFPSNNKEKDEERFPCDHCYYTAPRESTLRKHKLTVHDLVDGLESESYTDIELALVSLPAKDEDNKFSCDLCTFKASSSSMYRKHKLSVHVGLIKYVKKKYQCDQCSYKASRLRMLKAHKVNKHEADKPFPCDQCDYQALSAHILKIHKTSKHDRVQYHCDKCDYTTNWQANLTTHKRKKHIEPWEKV